MRLILEGDNSVMFVLECLSVISQVCTEVGCGRCALKVIDITGCTEVEGFLQLGEIIFIIGGEDLCLLLLVQMIITSC